MFIKTFLRGLEIERVRRGERGGRERGGLYIIKCMLFT